MFVIVAYALNSLFLFDICMYEHIISCKKREQISSIISIWGVERQSHRTINSTKNNRVCMCVTISII